MSYYFIFEDSENTPVSQMLKHSYNGDRIYFSNSGTRLGKKIKGVRNLVGSNGNIFLGFLDVVPNNRNTVNLYNRFCDSFSDYDNVFIIPILCIEYIVLKFLCNENILPYKENELLLIEDIVKAQNWNFPKGVLPKSDKHGGTMERVYKHILNDHSPSCLINISPQDKEKSIEYGKFYKEDCKCNNCTLCQYTLSKKAEGIYCTLPIFDVPDETYKSILNNLDIRFKTTTIDVVLVKCKNIYKQIDEGSDFGLVDIRFKEELECE